MRLFKIEKSSNSTKKYMVYEIYDGSRSRIIHFGAAGYEDFTIHKDLKRKGNYIARHTAAEDWSRSGLLTPGFWSRWLLWNETTITKSAEDIARRFNIRIIL